MDVDENTDVHNAETPQFDFEVLQNVKEEISPKVVVVKKKRKFKLPYASDKGRRYKCAACDMALTKNAMSSHYASHHGDDAYQCLMCQKVFIRPTSVKNHIRKVHFGSSSKLFRKMCRKDLPKHVQKELQTRIRSCFTEKDPRRLMSMCIAFNCCDCDGSFDSAEDLFKHCADTHRISETGEKYPYLVPIAQRYNQITKKWMNK